MERSFKTLFNLSVKHGYYDDDQSNDFLFVPSEGTKRDTKNFRLLTKNMHGIVGQPEAYGIVSMYSEVDSTPVIPISASFSPEMVFALRLHNKNFWNYTKDVEGLERGEIFHYTNVGATEVSGVIELERSRCRLKRSVFNYAFILPGPFPVSATLKILDKSNSELSEYEQTLSSENGKFEALVNLEGLPDGIYKVRVMSNGSTIQTDKYYISDQFAVGNPFAVVEIVLTDNTSLSDKKLEISFSPREELWKYFVVFNEVLTGSDVIEVGQTGATGLKFSEVTSFAGPSRLEDKVTKDSLEARYPDADVRLYESDETVKFHESPKKNIKLKKNATQLIQHMPSPSVSSVKAEAYILI